MHQRVLGLALAIGTLLNTLSIFFAQNSIRTQQAEIESMATTIDEAIEEIARNGFASVSINGHTTTVKSIDELIKAAQYLKGNEAIASDRPALGHRIQKIRPSYE